MSVHKLANNLYCHIHSNCNRKSLLCPCIAKKFTDNSWTIHHSEKCGKNPKYPLTRKCIIKVMYSYSENQSESLSDLSDSLQPCGILQARILEWEAFPFSRGSSHLRDWTQVSYIAGGFFTSWETREAQNTGVCSLSLFQGILLTQDRTGVSYAGVAVEYHIVEYYPAL